MKTFLLIAVSYPSLPVTLILTFWLISRWLMLPADRKRTEWLLVAAALALPASIFAEWFAGLLSRLRPLKYDLFVYRIDALFGEPSFVLGRIVNHHVALILLVSASYGLMPVAMVAVFGLYLWFRSQNDCIRILWTFGLDLFAAVPLYLLFPVCGPAYAFPEFPATPLHVSLRMIAINAPPNGVPSVHTATAMLVLCFLWRWRSGRFAGIVFLALTIFATLGSGQHYAFDLFCAVPYAVVIYFAAGRLTPRPDVSKSCPLESVEFAD